MPQFIRAAGYKIYFWSNESGEPIHFHKDLLCNAILLS